MNKIALLHYAGPPTIGGVELTLAHHARALNALGYSVRICSGTKPDPTAAEAGFTACYNPLFGSTHPRVLEVKAELDEGRVTDQFTALVADMKQALRESLAGCDVCIAHNILSLHKNLPLTRALAELHSEGGFKLISWSHDLAWTNAQYQSDMHDGDPWDLLRTAWPGVTYVTVSDPRQAELAGLLRVPIDQVHVVVPGVDLNQFYHLNSTVARLAVDLHLFEADAILLLPARITRRKNIALGLHVLASLRAQTRRDMRLIVTGPPGPHNPKNRGYLGELLDLTEALSLGDAAHFLYAHGESDAPLLLDDESIANLYHLSDLLFFPSTQEGFGIPVLEAGAAYLPIFCSDIPAFRSSGHDDVSYFDPINEAPATIAARIAHFLETHAPYRLRARVRQSYRWGAIVRDQIVPLVEGD